MNKELKDRLLALKQEHLIDHYESLNERDKADFLTELTKADLDKLALAFTKENANRDAEEITFQDVSIKEEIFDEETYKRGLELIQNGKAASLIMSGGMGSRLGFSGPKGAFLLVDDKSIFELHVDKLHAIQKKTGVFPYLLIMCSDLNMETTVRFFEERAYFGYPKDKIKFFQQGNIPACDEEYKILLEDKTTLMQVPDGNGGIFDALLKSGLLAFLKAEGVKWLQVAGVDNVLLETLDPFFVGFAENSGAKLASKSVARLKESEKVGIFALKNGKPSVLEYTEVDEELRKAKNEKGEYLLSEANIANHLFDLSCDEFARCLELPFHKAHKKISYFDGRSQVNPSKENAYKFEQFIFDAFRQFEKMALLRVRREDEFAPLKNKEGEDSIETAREAYLRQRRKQTP